MKFKIYRISFFLLILIVFLQLFSNLKKPHSGFQWAFDDSWTYLKFEFCNSLSNSRFDENVYIDAFKGSIREVNLPSSVFVKVIDTAAKNFFNDLNQRYDLDIESAKRFACYCAVSGRTMGSEGVSSAPLLKQLDPIIYFPFLSINQIEPITTFKVSQKINWKNLEIVADESNPLGVHITQNRINESPKAMDKSPFQSDFNRLNIDPGKKRYKIAYFIMAHGNKDCLVTLMDALYSQEAIYLIHIDANFPDFKTEIQQWIINSNFDNVYMMDVSFNGQWGGSSLVFIELEGFFKLIDLAEWDYVINLSVHDYPLANTSTIHQILELTPQKSYLAEWVGDPETLRRLSYTGIVSKDKMTITIDYRRPRLFPWVNRYPINKQSQWMALSRSFVQIIRKSQLTYDLLAYMENALLPDESFFSMLGYSPELHISDMIISRIVHFINFLPGESHPQTLHDGDHSIFNESGRYFFVRKVDASKERKLKAWIDEYRNNFPAFENFIE